MSGRTVLNSPFNEGGLCRVSEGTAMQRFFFNTADGTRVRDVEGVSLPDLGAARVQAIRFMGGLLSDKPEFLWDGRDFRVEVTNQEGRVLCIVVALAIDTADAARPIAT